mgnify:CR=1 FL=1
MVKQDRNPLSGGGGGPAVSKYVCVVGPDGSGKSSVARYVCESLRQQGLEYSRIHADPKLTSDSDIGACETPHGALPHGTASSVLAIVRRLFRYLNARASGPLAKGHPGIVIHERGWLDQVVDPCRYRLPSWTGAMTLMLNAFVRKPDLVLNCVGDPAVMHDRKGEIGADETARQLAQWQSLLTSLPTVEVNTTDSPVDQTEEVACEAVLDLVRAATTSRLVPARSVPLAPRRLSALYTPGASRCLPYLLRRATVLGRYLGLASSVLSRGSLTRPLSGLPFDVEGFAHSLGIPLDAYAAIRSHNRRQWVVALAHCGEPSGFLKVVPGDGQSLAHEQAMLEYVQGQIQGVSTPEVIGLVTVSDWSALATSVAIDRPRPPRVDFQKATEICTALAAVHGGRGVTHGDLAPWNILEDSRGRIALVDWEFASVQLRPGYDLKHYRQVAASRHMSRDSAEVRR